MKVILLERIESLGLIGETVKVKDGFARNYLLPRKKALRASEANLRLFEAQKEQIHARNLAARADAEKIAENLDGQNFVVIRQAGETGHLYGSVSARDVVESLNEAGHNLNRNQIVLNIPIKTLGLHRLRIRLHAEVYAQITINIARSHDEAERQEKGENVIASRFAEDRAHAEEANADLLEGGAGQAVFESNEEL